MSAARRKSSAGDVVPIDYDALADALAPRVAALVFQRMAAALGGAETPFSTRAGHAPPEFEGRPKAWRRVAPSIPGSVKLGRWVSVSRAAYATWLETKATTGRTASASASASAPAPEAWSPATVAERLGLRVVGGGGGR